MEQEPTQHCCKTPSCTNTFMDDSKTPLNHKAKATHRAKLLLNWTGFKARLRPTFGFVGVGRADVAGQHEQALLARVVQPQVHLPPRLELLGLLVLEVSQAVVVPQLIRVLHQHLKQTHTELGFPPDSSNPSSLGVGVTGIPAGPACSKARNSGLAKVTSVHQKALLFCSCR